MELEMRFFTKPLFNQFEDENGDLIEYKGCSSNEREDDFYGAENYIGSSYVTYHNGTRNVWDELHYFYSKPHKNANCKPYYQLP